MTEATAKATPMQILLVDDTPENLLVLTHTLAGQGHELSAANGGARALKLAKKKRPDLILLDVMMPEIDGFEVCRRLKEDPDTAESVIIFCSALDDTASKVRGFELGGADFIAKPFQPEEVIARVATHLALGKLRADLSARNKDLERELRVAEQFRREALERLGAPLLGKSGALKNVTADVERAGATDEPFLLVSEADCGDEAVARAIHQASSRSHRAFVMVDCALLHPSTQSTVIRRSDGSQPPQETKLGMAEGGTLYLSEVDRLGEELQEQLNDFLTRQADPQSVAPDVRILASLSSSRSSGTFPKDFEVSLIQKLKRNVVRLPSLVERREDVPALAAHFCEQHCLRLGRASLEITRETEQALTGYDWPGNLRELEDVILKSVVATRGSFLVVDERLLEPGTPLDEYRLLRKLGVGGMGEVWEARHRLLTRRAAIKLIKPGDEDTARREQQLRRFTREARVTANLHSRNTVELYDFGVTPEDSFFYVMELLDGIDLESIVTQFGKLPPERVAQVLRQSALSLAEAHESGLVHRDVKPANLFLCRLGLEVDVLKVLDFGMVSQKVDAQETRLTQENAVCGTPMFMSPEGALATEELTDKADIYSLGCVAFWLLTGTYLFDAPTTMALLLKHVTEAPPSVSDKGVDIPPELENLISACLSKSPAVRPSARELLARIDATGLASTWTARRAEAWWQTHGPEAAPPMEEEAPPTEALKSSR